MSKEKFKSKSGFILASIGAAVGLGNALRFPGLCARYGGGSFLLIYFAALVILGLPLLNAEIALGRKLKSGAPRCMEYLARPKFKKLGGAVGWASGVNSVLTAVIYAGLAGWIIATVFNIVPLSLSAKQLSQAEISSHFFKNVLSARSDGVIDGISFPVLGGIAAAWILMYFCLRGGASSLAKAARFTVIIPITLLVIMAGRGLMYENAPAALAALFVPDFAALSSAELWLTALGQVFFSLSIVVGIMPVYGSYLPEGTNIFSCSLAVASADFLVSVLASVVLFTTLYGCGLEGMVTDSGVITAFQVYPAAITRLFGANVVLNAAAGVLFYSSLAMMAVQSAVSMLEAFVAPYAEGKGVKKKGLVKAVCISGAAVSLLFATTAAPVIVEVADKFVNFYHVLLLGIAECLLFAFSQKTRDISGEIMKFGRLPAQKRRKNHFFVAGASVAPEPAARESKAKTVAATVPAGNARAARASAAGGAIIFSLRFLCPAVLISLSILQFFRLFTQGLAYPLWLQIAFGWGLTVFVVSCAIWLIHPPILSKNIAEIQKIPKITEKK